MITVGDDDDLAGEQEIQFRPMYMRNMNRYGNDVACLVHFSKLEVILGTI